MTRISSSKMKAGASGPVLGSVLGLVLLTSACAVGPDYVPPAVTAPLAFKAPTGWSVAAPGDHLDRGDWWTLFGDPVLNDLAARAETANQTIAAADAAYRQARATTRETRSDLFPAVDLSGSGAKSGGDGQNGDSESYQVGIGASWEPDLWGRIRRSVESAGASAEAGAADLASAHLSIQGELAANYLNLRETDAEVAILDQTIAAYERAQTITQNRYDARIAPRTDVLQAQTQLANARSERIGLERTRATYENAIAVLVGENASTFTIAAVADWSPVVPDVPLGVPSEILQRRPDIASAERAVAAANATIGVQQAAFFPTLSLTGSVDQSTNSLGDLFASSANVWSLGLGLAQTVFDAGARGARVEQARAAYDGTVAAYRLSVLTAFQDVEDQLTASDVLARQYMQIRQASEAADQTEALTLNQYRAGLIAYTDVVTAQASALSARRSLLQAGVDRQTSAVALIQALGGGWDGVVTP